MDKVDNIIQYLDHILPDARCELEYSSPYQLLVAVILSAQCTDLRVNQVTRALFDSAPTPHDMLALGEVELKVIIHSCGFFNSKARAIIDSSRDIIAKHDGVVPRHMDELITLRGVGRKTANVVLGECFGVPSMAVDTHVHRVSKRLGLCDETDDPNKCEQKLIHLFPSSIRTRLHHQLVHFGRYHCKSLKPNCDSCELKQYCKRK